MCGATLINDVYEARKGFILLWNCLLLEILLLTVFSNFVLFSLESCFTKLFMLYVVALTLGSQVLGDRGVHLNVFLLVCSCFSRTPLASSHFSPAADGGPRETLMHFAVRLGLLRLAWLLLQKPGGRGALSIHNQEGATPASLALQRGYHKLHKLLTE